MVHLSRRCTGLVVSILLALGAQLHAQTVINSVTDLQAMQNDVTASYVLGGNIDASSTSTANGGVGFTPIGTASKPFTGTFDGKGYTITGLSINSSLPYVGLFGYIASPSVVKNVSLSGGSVTAIGTGGTVGTLIGMMGPGTSVTQCSAQGTLQASNGTYVGGLVGFIEGSPLSYCQASVNVTSTTAGGSIGGLVGYAGNYGYFQTIYTFGNIQYSQASGNVSGLTSGSSQAWIGGLIGRNGISLLSHSRATGNVTGTGASQVGGLVGQNVGWLISCTEDTCNNANVQPLAGITYSFATGAVATGAGGDAGGLIGDTQDGYIYQDFATGSVTNTDGGGREGGLLGVSEGSAVEDSYATGSVTDNTALSMGGLIGLEEYFYYASKWQITPILSSLYSIGAVEGQYPKYAGGLVGEDTSGRGATCAYWATDSSLQSNSADGTGVLLAQLDSGSLPSCFDSSIWTPTSGAPPTLIANPRPASGYVNPKYQIMGVTYAPPGASSSTFVQYQNSTTVGSTQSISQSFKDENNLSVSLSVCAGTPATCGTDDPIPGFKAGTSVGVSYDSSQQIKTTSSLTTMMQIQQGEKTFGTGNYFSPVNHDYDLIWVWLNPLVLFSVYPAGSAGVASTPLTIWNGYGFDAADQPDLDVIGIPLGYLNGDFGPMPPQYLNTLTRIWAAEQAWPTGQSSALTSADFAQIAAADPFSSPTYGYQMIGIDPPSSETPDHRYTVSQCSGGASFPYTQASPSSSAETYTCTLTNTNTSMQAKDVTNTYSVQFTVDLKFKANFILGGLDGELKEQNTLTWTTEYQSSITNTTVSTASLSVQSPPCNNVVQGLGPCVPVYDAAGNEPVQFSIYQDNMYGTFMFAPVGYYTGSPSTVATPQFSPAAGSYNSPQSVTISSATPGSVLYYTTDGTVPTITSNQYTGPITVKASETLQAIAVASGYTPSAVGSAAYTITGLGPAATPTFSVPAGTYSLPQSVSLADATSGATIYYTTNGSTPSTSSTIYSGPIPVNGSETIEAIAVAPGYTTSSVASAAYTITTPQTAMPGFSVTAGTYLTTQTVTIFDPTPGAVIYYTINGTTPTTSSTVYGVPIIISSTETIEAFAVAPGYTQSYLASAQYTITPPTALPTFSLVPGTYFSTQTVTLSDPTSGAVIYYTTNGATPSTSSPVYTGSISVSSTETIQAIAVAPGYTQSGLASAQYTITSQTATPGFSLAPGSYMSAQTVVISDPTPGAVIYYTVNGTTPTTSSPVYGGSVSVSTTETIQAIAVAPGYTQSGLASAQYTITPPTATPSFSTSGGIYASGLTVSISDGTPGAVIYYTTTGATPTSSSPVYNGPITIGTTETLQAMAVASGYSASAVAFAVYTISASAATPTFNPVAGAYTTAQSVTIGDLTPGATIYYTTNGTTPTASSSVYNGAIPVNSSTTIQAIAIAAGYSASALGAAAYTITSPPMTATPTMSVPPGAYSSTQMVTITDSTPGATIYYTTNGSQPTAASTPYTTAIMVGTTETIEAIAIATGYVPSTTASAAYTINAPAADFQITSSASILTIAQGKSSTVTITINPEYGFAAPVSFGCGGLPSGATCSFSPISVTPSGTSQSSTLTISTTSSNAMLHNSSRHAQQVAYALLLPGLLTFYGIASRRRRILKGLRPLSLLLLLVMIVGITSCSGTTSSGVVLSPPTPTGTAVITVYGVSNGPTAVTHMAFISVTVTQ